MHKTIEELQSELHAQDQALAAAKEQLASFGDIQFQMPTELLEQLDNACMVQALPNIQFGAVRA